MGARDNVLFSADIASGTVAGTVIPLSLLYGVENVRQGYGTPKLKHAVALFDGVFTAGYDIPVEIKNSNWIDSAGVIAQLADDATTLNRDSLSFMRGRDMILAPNTSWIINATLPTASTAAGTVYVLLEIEYSDVPGVDAEKLAGAPVMKKCSTASVTAAANVPVNLGSFDNLLQDVTYVLSEASIYCTNAPTSANFLLVEGFSNQRGLTRIIPIRNTGLADQIEGSVYLKKQTYNLGLIRSIASSAIAVDVYLEMVASKN